MAAPSRSRDGVQHGDSFASGVEHGGLDLLVQFGLFAGAEHAGKAQGAVEVGFAGGAVQVGGLAKGGHVGLEQGAVELPGAGDSAVQDGDVDLHVAARDAAL